MSAYVNIQTEWLTVMTVTEAVVYGYLHGWLVDRGDKAVPFRQTQGAMSAALHMKERTFKLTLSKLVGKGFVTVQRRPDGLAYACMINNVESAKIAQSAKSAQSANITPSECKNCTNESANIAPSTLLNIYNNHDINTRENAHARAREDEEKEAVADAAEEARMAAEEARRREAEERREYEAKQVQKVGVDELTRELRQEVEGGSQLSESLTRLYGLDRRQQMEYVGWFLDTLRVQGVKFKVRSDYRKHFLSWLNRKMIDSKKNMTKDEQRIERNKKLFSDLL